MDRLAPDAVDTSCSASYTLKQSDIDAGLYANTASVSASGNLSTATSVGAK